MLAPPVELMEARLASGETTDVFSVEFIKTHWRPIGDLLNAVRYRCAMHDPVAKRCMAHDSRPPVCRGFPWYGRPPDAGRLWSMPECEFWADLPPNERPVGWKPKLASTVPITTEVDPKVTIARALGIKPPMSDLRDENIHEAAQAAKEEAEAAGVTPAAVMHSAPEGYGSGTGEEVPVTMDARQEHGQETIAPTDESSLEHKDE